MFLYKKREYSLDVYSLSGNKEAMIKYRQNEMLQIPEEERILVAEAYSATRGKSPLFEKYSDHFDTRIIPIEYANLRETNYDYHLLGPDESVTTNKKTLLDRYYFGHFSDKNIARIQDLNKLRYFLLSKEKYEKEPSNHKKEKLKDIIELPESLYLLQMVEQGKFSLLRDKDISEQLDFFSASYIDEINLEELKKMDVCDITKITYDEAINKAKTDAHILKLVKK